MKWIALGLGYVLALAVIMIPFRVSSEQSQIEEEIWRKEQNK